LSATQLELAITAAGFGGLGYMLLALNAFDKDKSVRQYLKEIVF